MQSIPVIMWFGLSALFVCANALGQTKDLPGPEVVQIKLSVSNAYLLKSERPILVDTGSPNDRPALEQALAEHKLKWNDVALVVLTHAHTDHAGLAAAFQKTGSAKVALFKADAPMAQAGHVDELKPTNLMGGILKRFFNHPDFDAFTPDLVLTGELDLHPWGVAGKVIAAPGHTPGSSVVLLDDGRAIVGDLLLGGYLNGALSPGRAGQHYFVADSRTNAQSVAQLLALKVETFFLGHGGPLTRAAVLGRPDLANPEAHLHR